MDDESRISRRRLYFMMGLLLMPLVLVSGAAYAHGGKGHAAQEFTRLQAIQKATELFDRLISSNKLDGTWETRLTGIGVAIRTTKGKDEFVVSFKRDTGNRNVVYFFFDLSGGYSGSNFTGQ